jgi:hypothetical protein
MSAALQVLLNGDWYDAYSWEIATWGGLVAFYIRIFRSSSLLSIFSYGYTLIIQSFWPFKHWQIATYCRFIGDYQDFHIYNGAEFAAHVMGELDEEAVNPHDNIPLPNTPPRPPSVPLPNTPIQV